MIKKTHLFLITILLVFISILSGTFLPFFGVFISASVIGLSIPTMYYITSRESKKKSFDRQDDFEKLGMDNGFDEIYFREFEEEQKELEDLFILIGNDKIFEFLNSDLDFVSMLDLQDFPLTVVSPQFWTRINQFEFEKHEKLAFIKEMLSFPLEDREKFITTILRLKENQNKKRQIRIMEE